MTVFSFTTIVKSSDVHWVVFSSMYLSNQQPSTQKVELKYKTISYLKRKTYFYDH
jgi:hypothetical protein